MRLAHRVSWILSYGEIPQGMLVLHHCDNTFCVNPTHLFLGTQRDNVHDALAKGRMPQIAYSKGRPRKGRDGCIPELSEKLRKRLMG